MKRMFFALLVGLAALPSCEFFTDTTIPVEDQLTGTEKVVVLLHKLQRWLPLTHGDRDYVHAGIAAFPFDLTWSANAPIATSADIDFDPAPDRITCNTGCTGTWTSMLPTYDFTITFDTNGTPITAAGTFSDASGQWQGQYGRNLTATTVALTSPKRALRNWTSSCNAHEICNISTSYENSLSSSISMDFSQRHLSAIVDNIARDRDTVAPVSSHTYGAFQSTTRHTSYTDGLTAYTHWDAVGNWQHIQYLPVGNSQQDNQGLQWQGEYPTDALLKDWQLSAVASTTTSFSSWRETWQFRRQAQRTVDITIVTSTANNITQLRWQEDDLVGVIEYQSISTGLRLDAFWQDQRDGKLYMIDGFVDIGGVWSGQYEAWHPDDEDTPRESGDWLMLPHGIITLDVLFVQLNDTSTDITVQYLPEGFSEATLQRLANP